MYTRNFIVANTWMSHGTYINESSHPHLRIYIFTDTYICIHTYLHVCIWWISTPWSNMRQDYGPHNKRVRILNKYTSVLIWTCLYFSFFPTFCFCTRIEIENDGKFTGLMALMENGYQDPVNLGNPDEYTIRHFAELVTEITNSSSKIVHQEVMYNTCICIYEYVCVCIYIYVYMYIHINICIRICMNIFI